MILRYLIHSFLKCVCDWRLFGVGNLEKKFFSHGAADSVSFIVCSGQNACNTKAVISISSCYHIQANINNILVFF